MTLDIVLSNDGKLLSLEKPLIIGDLDFRETPIVSLPEQRSRLEWYPSTSLPEDTDDRRRLTFRIFANILTRG